MCIIAALSFVLPCYHAVKVKRCCCPPRRRCASAVGVIVRVPVRKRPLPCPSAPAWAAPPLRRSANLDFA